MAKTKMGDMIVLLPGIMGSELQKDGKDIWAISFNMIRNGIRSRFRMLQQLKLNGDSSDDLVQPSKLFDDVSIIPGFAKIDGYSGIRRMIQKNFNVTTGTIHDDVAANYIEFPYDWRRDNRRSAKLLKEMIDIKLARWRDHWGDPSAQVILIAHSMGGLVSRYYLEKLEGWKNCKLLITLGTPHRGSLNTLDTISNGVKKLGIDLTDVARSFTSTYQLLPRYKSVVIDGATVRPRETDQIPNLSKKQATEGNNFLIEISNAVTENHQNDEYRHSGYEIIPVVGTLQKTSQSAVVENGKLKLKNELSSIDIGISHGDGTVPYISAIPIELSDEFRESYFPEHHGPLTNNPQIMGYLRQVLRKTQVDIKNFQGPGGAEFDPSAQKALSLDIPDVIEADEPLEILGEALNAKDNVKLTAEVVSVSGLHPTQRVELQFDDGQWRSEVTGLPADDYRVTLGANDADISAVSDVVAVAEVE